MRQDAFLEPRNHRALGEEIRAQDVYDGIHVVVRYVLASVRYQHSSAD
jgi:hypothetical protein